MMRNMTQKINDILMEKLLNPGSRLRCAYETGIKGAGVIGNEGISSFIKKLKLYLYRNYIQPDLYAQWILENEDYSESYLSRVQDKCNNFQCRPKFSIIFPVFNTEKLFLKKAIDSVLSQVYDNWELCAVDGNSVHPMVKELLLDYSKRDKRIKVTFLPKNEGIVGNSNRSLQMATGDFVAFLDHDDELSPLALSEFAGMLNDDSSIDIIYSDEDKIDTAGKRFEPMFKPDWSLDNLRCCNYINHFLAIRKDLALLLGGFRNDFEGAQDYDFILRAVENAKKICHNNEVLYHWRSHSGSIASNAWCKRYAHESGKKALQEHICRQEKDALVLNGKDPFRFNVRYRYNLRPTVSIILSSQGRTDFIRSSIESILKKSTYKNYEIMIANSNGLKVDHDCLVGLDDSSHSIKWLDYHGPYSCSAVNNLAARSCSGDVLIFLDECLEVVSSDWIESLIEHALRDRIGAVGGLVLSPEGRVRHAGLVLGQNDGTDYICAGMTLDEVEANPAANLMVNYVRNVSAVSGSCLCISKKKFLDAGGFMSRVDEGADVHLCLKIIEMEYLNIYTPFPIFSCKDVSYGRDAIPIDTAIWEDISSKFSAVSRMKDPYYSENFDHSSRVPAIGVKQRK